MTASKKTKIAVLVLLTLSFLSAATASAMETIFVTASQKAGRYDGPIYVRLTASDPEAKIWYTCRRNGTPSDLLKYESPILLDRSCALIYFAYVTTELESKIERTDYTILYSDAVKLETANDMLGLRNTGKDTVDIGGWELIAGTGGITIPPGTTLLPGASYSIGHVDPASYELKSPEGYTKSQLSVIPVAPPVKKTVAKVPKTVAAPIVETLVPVADTGTTISPTAIQPAITSVSETPVPSPTAAPVATIPATATPTAPEITSDIKASSTESKNTSALPIVAALALIAAGAAVGKRYMEKKE